MPDTGPLSPTRRQQYGSGATSPPVGGPTLGVKNPAGDILNRITGGRGRTITDKGMPIGQLNIEGLRRILIAHGYHIPASGNGVGKIMKSALADFLNPKKLDTGGPLAHVLSGTHITGRRDPAKWNKLYAPVGPKGRPVVGLSPQKTLDKQGNPKPGNAEQAGPAASPQTVNLSGLQSMAAAAGIPIPTSLAAQLANAGAGAQFDPQIHDVQQLIAQEPVDASQHLHDINSWYGQIQNALGTAGKRDTAATRAGVSSLGDAVSSILSSLGGKANAGAANVGATGANDVGTLQALGTSQDMLNNDLAPIFAQEKASTSRDQANKDALGKTALVQQLEDLQGQRGQAVTSQRDSVLMQILGQNNSLAQQGFQNRLAVQQAGEAAQLNGLKALYYANKGNAPVKGSFGYATPRDINGVQTQIQNHLTDANGNLLPGMTPAKAAALARTIGSTYFPNGGVPMGWAQSVVAPYFGS